MKENKFTNTTKVAIIESDNIVTLCSKINTLIIPKYNVFDLQYQAVSCIVDGVPSIKYSAMIIYN